MRILHRLAKARQNWRANIPNRVTCIFLITLLIGCDPAANENKYLDKGQLLNEATSLAGNWREHAPLPNGFQQTQFDTKWQSSSDNKAVDLTSQSRLIYVYATAYEISGDIKYLEALRKAADFMLAHMLRPEEAGWYKSVDRTGSPIGNSIHTYGYSFAIFAMAHAYRATQDGRYLTQAIYTWQSGVWLGLSAAREWKANGRLPVTVPDSFWSQNPFMHLFEALLSLYEVTKSPAVWVDIGAMAKFLEEKLLQPCGCLPEWYVATSFSPQHGEDTRLYLGHQVEWAFLLSRAVQLGLDDRYLDTANGLLNFSLRHGIDRESGGLQATSSMNGQEGDKSYWWWAQAELMRATVHFAREHGRKDLYSVYEKAQLFARMHFIDLGRRNWINESPYFADEQGKLRQVIGYHWMAFYTEALLPYK